MAITRRQFVTRLGALAAAAGLSQTQIMKVTEALGHSAPFGAGKPKVIWVHGAECTGCSTSLLGLFEDVQGKGVEDKRLITAVDPEGDGLTTLNALDLMVGGDGNGGHIVGPDGAAALAALGITKETGSDHPFGHRTLWENGLDMDANANGDAWNIASIADVLIDFIDLQYHETVMGMGGAMAYEWLMDEMDKYPASTTDPFVLVVEGAVQVSSAGGAWDKTGAAPWCSIGMAEDPASHGEHEFDDVVATLAGRPDCLATIAIGQCACFGGYPGCVSPEFGESQSPAYGVHDFLTSTLNSLTPDERTRAGNRVVNVPGCPTNPWWFVLTVVLWVAEAANGPLKSTPVAGPLGILGSDFAVVGGVDSQRRLKAVYGPSIHGPSCPRYKYAFPNWNGPGTAAKYASYPGDIGCLALIGCKGNSTNSLCALHGWNAQQPHNNTAWDQGLAQIQGSIQGGFCVAGGHPCMGCTEKGYPDAYVPFITQR